MSKRLAYLGLGALLLAINSGCCLVNCINCWHDRHLAHYQATHFHDCGCGEVFVNNWYNSPPQCCDPCDQWGNFTGRKWWVPNCQGCRGDGCCGPGSCPGISPAGRMNGPGDMGGQAMYDDGAPMMGETITPVEEVPMPAQSSRRNPSGYRQGSAPQNYRQSSTPQGNRQSSMPQGYRQSSMSQGYRQSSMQQGYRQGSMPQNGPARMSRQPRNVRPADQRVARRQPTAADGETQPADYQTGSPFYDDAEASAAGGYRVSTSTSASTANYRR